ncbi:hypothetical protein A2U01_0043123, partial [Trifolium medium]|nr:hypothetical protein [Trifolium medium]
MYRRGWHLGVEGWSWRRRLFVKEKELYLEYCAALENLFLQVGVQDCWKWCLDPDSGYSVSGAYHLLTNTIPLTV